MFSKFFIEHPRFAAVISLLLVITGSLTITKLPVADYPEISPPQIRVSATYSGASAEVLRDTVALVLESELNGLENLLYFDSECSNTGSYSCSLTFKTGTNSDIAMVEVQNAVKRSEAKLPSEVQRTGVDVRKRTGDLLAMFQLMTDGSHMSELELNNYASTTIADAISRIDGVSAADVFGGMTFSMRIWIDPIRMGGLGISTDDIKSAVESQNIQAAAGMVGSEGGNDFVQFKVDIKGRLKTQEEFENIIIKNDSDGNILRLKDIARVELGADSYASSCRYNGKSSVGLGVFKTTDANALNTVNAVKAELKRLSRNFPEGVSWETAYDPTKFIEISMREIVVTLLSALALVVLITYLFLQDWRATIIPAVAIPISLVGTFTAMYALGYSINLLTMFGLILVIGSLVDDAIVVVENCQSVMQRDKLDSKSASIKSMKQITGAVIATTLVTIACYVPLAFYGGMVGEIYTQFAVTMCVALSISTLVALTLSPALCAIMLRNANASEKRIFAPVNFLINKSRDIYTGIVGIFAKRIPLTFLIFCAISGISYILFGYIRSSFIPTEDKGSIMCEIELPPGASLARTESATKKFESIVSKIDGIKNYMTVNGHGMINGNGENVAMAIVELEDWSVRKTPELSIYSIVKQIQYGAKRIPEASVMAFTPPAIMGLGITGGISFSLTASGEVSTREIMENAKKLAAEISSMPGVTTAMSSNSGEIPQFSVKIDREKAESLGIPVSSIFSTLQSNIASYYINDFNILGDVFEVNMQAEKDMRSTLEDLMELQIQTSDGEMTPMGTVANAKYGAAPKQISMYNKLLSTDVNVMIDSSVSSGEIMDKIENIKLPFGYDIAWTNMSYQEKQNENKIVSLMALAILFAYLFLVAQYESWTIPVPIMMTVATPILGALIGLLITGESFSIYAQLGMVMLVGLTAKNAILMVEFSKQEREAGVPIYESAVSGARQRFRAVMMTALSFVFGVLPLVVATGAGAASRRAIGITTFSGMLMATILGIIMTPCLYALVQTVREYSNTKMGIKMR